MKLSLFILVSVLLLAPTRSLALDLGGGTAKNIATNAGYSGGTTETTFSQTLGTVVRAALSLVGIIFMSLMVYAGYLWMTARGEESRIEKAQEIIRASVIGLIITVSAYSITVFVVPRILDRPTSPGETTIGAPTQ